MCIELINNVNVSINLVYDFVICVGYLLVTSTYENVCYEVFFFALLGQLFGLLYVGYIVSRQDKRGNTPWLYKCAI